MEKELVPTQSITKTVTPDDLKDVHRAFAERYIENGFNAWAAAKATGFHPKHGSRLVRNKKIRAYIDARLDELVMSANEVLVRLSEQAKSDYSPYITEDGEVDMEKLVADGKGHLIKGIRQGRWGTVVEFYNAQDALALLMKYYGLSRERLEVDVRQVNFHTIEIRHSEPAGEIVEGEVLPQES